MHSTSKWRRTSRNILWRSGMSTETKTETDPGPASLDELEARLKRDFELLVMPPAKDWLEPRTHPDHGPVLDVAVVGAGMSGLAAAFALKCLAVRSLRMFDRSPAGFEGPWATFARMETLRSPPELSGPSFGFANLTFRAWFEAQFGLAAWKKVYRIPRLQWMDYLRWYRRMIDVPIENETALTDIGGDGEFVVLTLRSNAGTRKVAARRVVLANGRDGLGGAYTPTMFRGLDRRYVRHSVDDIDFEALRGKVVGVLGAGASAVDNAAEALEHGATRVAMLVRRPDVPRINKGMGIGSAGFWVGFHALTHAQRWSIVNYIDEQAVPPPRELDAARDAPQEFFDHPALRADRGAHRGRPRAARHDARDARLRFPDPGDRADGRLGPAPGIRRAETACAALGS